MADFDEGRAAIESAKILTLPGQEPVKLRFQPFVWRDPATIPRRHWLYGFELRRKQVSAFIAPGAAGKTTFKVARAICMVTGRDLMGHRVWNGPHKVALWNLEDEMEECEKAVHAFCKLWGITGADLDGRLFVNGADDRDSPFLKMAIEGQGGGYVICKPVVGALIDAIREQGVDYTDIDPFVSFHSVPENDNGAIDAVTKECLHVAVETNSALSVAHHVKKVEAGRELNAADSRGAVALINTARSVLVINSMSADEATSFNIPACDRRNFFRVYDDKNNKAPPAEKSRWYEFVGVDLGNADIGSPGPADNVAAVRCWSPPDPMGAITKAEMMQLQKLIDEKDKESGRVRKNFQANRWVGKLVAQVLALNLDDPTDVSRIKTMVGVWLANGMLKSMPGKTANGDDTDFVVVGNRVQFD